MLIARILTKKYQDFNHKFGTKKTSWAKEMLSWRKMKEKFWSNYSKKNREAEKLKKTWKQQKTLSENVRTRYQN